jgi:itaconate CoA-transferase
MHDLWDHPQLKARDRWVTVETPAGPIPALIPPGMTEARMGAVPELGEHTEPILRELGYNEEVISRLRTENAI